MHLQKLWILPAIVTLLAASPSARAASATWTNDPTDGNWETTASETNWSLGPGLWPGGTSTSDGDTATFNTNSSVTNITINGSDWNIKAVLFDTPYCSAYTITNTVGGAEARWTGGGSITINAPVNQPQIIGGVQMRLHSGGGLSLINNATNPAATLTFAAPIKANNSTSTNAYDQAMNLQGTNTGLNTVSGVISDYATPANGEWASVLKSGPGTWYLTAVNTYTGPTLITNGTLYLSGAGAINDTTNLTVSGQGSVLSFTNVISLATANNNMFVTNSGSVQMTDPYTQNPLTVANLIVSNATFHLAVNGSAPFYNIIANTSLTAGPNVTLEIDQIAQLNSLNNGPTTFTLISYAGADPSPSDFNVVLNTNYVNAGYTMGAVNIGGGVVQVTITPPNSTPLTWVGETNSVLVSNWDINKTADWLNQNSLQQTYADPDPVTFDDSAANSVVTLITTNSPGSVTFNNYNLTYRLNGAGRISGQTGLTVQGGGSVTLAETGGDNFSGGITVNSGTLVLDDANNNISGGLNLNSGTVQIGNSDTNGALPAGPVNDNGTLIFSRTNNVLVSTAILGGGNLAQSGTGTLTLNSSNGYTGFTGITAGKLALTGSGTVSNSYVVQITNGTLDVSSEPGTIVTSLAISNATLNISVPYLQPGLFVEQSLSADGTAFNNIINIASLPPIASYPATVTVLQSAGISLAYGNNFNFALGSLPSGYTAAPGSLVESADGTSILLTLSSGPTGTRPSVVWNGTNNASIDTNWSDNANWELPGAPTTTDNVVFNGNGTLVGNNTTINNVVNNNFTIATLTYNQPTSGQWHVTDIPAGNTLTVSGTTTVGGLTADNSTTSAAMTGGGTLSLNGNLTIGNTGPDSQDSGTILDLSGLSNFVYNGSSDTITLGIGSRSAASLNLAGSSNNITVATMALNTASSSSSGSGTVQLGSGTNIINAGTLNVGAERSSTTIQFQTATGGLRLRGTAGTDASRTTVVLGNRNAGGSSGTTTGNLSLAGHQVDMKISTLTVGQCNQASPVIGNGELLFDTGVVDATTVNMAVNSNTGTADGSVTVGPGATMLVGTGGISLVNQTSTGTAAGTLVVSNGTLICSNQIIKSTASGTGTITFVGNGTLEVLSGTIGTPAAPIDALNLDSGTLEVPVSNNSTSVVATAISVTGGITTLNISSIANVPGTTQIPVISYTGNGVDPYANLRLGTVPGGFTVGNGGALVDNQANQTIDIIVTPLTWVGAVGSTLNSSWDNGVTADWKVGSTASTYVNPDTVLFNDSASNGTVNVTAALSPNSITVTNSALNYTFGGSGSLNVAAGLAKSGTATLTLNETGGDNISGGITVGNNGGTLVLNNAYGVLSGATTIGTGGTVQVGNSDTNGALPSGSITDNGTLTYKHTDNPALTNSISGTGVLSQSGSGVLTVSGANTNYTGSINVVTGTLQAGSGTALGASNATIVVASGATLDDNGQNLTAYTNITVSGSGVNGQGAIVNNGAQQTSAFGHLILAGNTTVGGTNRWDLRLANGSLLTGGQPYSLTKVGTNQISLVDGGIQIDPALSNIVIQAGTFAIQEAGVTGYGTNGAFIVYSNATLEVDYGDTLTNTTKLVVLLDGATLDSANNANSLADPITLGTNAVGAAGNATFNITGTSMTLSNVVSGTGNLILTGTSTLVLTTPSTYTGNTMINGGTLALNGNGAIATSPNISIAAGAALNVSGRVNQTLALGAGQTLSGFGTVTGIVNTAGGSIVAPGSATATGVLSINGATTLGGASDLKVNGASSTNDVLSVTGSLALGGTLNVSLLNGNPAPNATFTLFKATGGISGTFTATNLPALGAGLAWNTSNLGNGVLSVIATSQPVPYITGVQVSGATLTLTATNGLAGQQFILLSTTNLALPLSQWTPVLTNAFNGSGNLNLSTNIVNPAIPQQFYLLTY